MKIENNNITATIANSKEDCIIIALDRTCIKITNRGQDDWQVEYKKERLSQDPCCCEYKDQGNPCIRSNRWKDTRQ